jgi:hypothetical protein
MIFANPAQIISSDEVLKLGRVPGMEIGNKTAANMTCGRMMRDVQIYVTMP